MKIYKYLLISFLSLGALPINAMEIKKDSRKRTGLTAFCLEESNKENSNLSDKNSERETKRLRLSHEQASIEGSDSTALPGKHLAESDSRDFCGKGHDLESLDRFMCATSDEVKEEIAIEKEKSMLEEMRNNLGTILNTIPDELYIGILTYLPCQDLVISSLVSKYFNLLSSENILWKIKAQIFGIPIEGIPHLKSYCLPQIKAIFKSIKGKPGPLCKEIAAEFPSLPFTSLRLFYCFLDYSLDNPEKSLPPISEQKFSSNHHALEEYNLGSIQIALESVKDEKKLLTFSTFAPLTKMNIAYQLKQISPSLASDTALLQLNIAYEDLPLKVSYSAHPLSDKLGARTISIKHFIGIRRGRKQDVKLDFIPKEQNHCRELTVADFFGKAPVPDLLFLAHTVENDQITTQLKLDAVANFESYEQMGDFLHKNEEWTQALYYYSKIVPVWRGVAGGVDTKINNLTNLSDIASSTDYKIRFPGQFGDNLELISRIKIKMMRVIFDMGNVELAKIWFNNFKYWVPPNIPDSWSKEWALLTTKLEIP